DLFAHIERIKRAPGFHTFRLIAEREARRRNPDREDVTFDDIYEEIDETFKSLKQFEMDFELTVLVQNPELKAVFDYAKSKGKKIIIMSDMYMPTDFIAKALKKNGFDGYDGIYVSSDLGKTKFKGTMYKHVLAELGVRPKDILHIGDNRISDYLNPRNYGIRAVQYERLKKQFLRYSKRARIFINQTYVDVDAGILVMMLAMRWQKKMLGLISTDYWEDIGYEYAGTIGYGYSRWIRSQATIEGLNELLFIARDGYTIQRIFDTLGSGIKSHYVYAARIFNLIFRLDCTMKSRQPAGNIINYYSKIDSEIRELVDRTRFIGRLSQYHFIQNNKDIFKKYSTVWYKNYKNYLSKIISGADKIGIVDTTAGLFNAQKLIQDATGLPVVGLYWVVKSYRFKVRPRDLYDFREFVSNAENSAENTEETFSKNWNFFEFLFTAPEYPVENLTEDGRPIYKSERNDNDAIVHRDIYPIISDGAVLFAEDVKKIFGGEDIFLKAATLVKWLNCFNDNPTKRDIRMMSTIWYLDGINHSDWYNPIFSAKIPFFYAMRHPLRTLDILEKATWRTTMQSIIVCIFFPLGIRIHGSKYLWIQIFPKLRRRFADLSLKFIDRYPLRISIGYSGPRR
ncbi:MAG: HAD-IA family hydrolase, partial [Rickettsiales bacterium]|nr:HAD-IA family hydrolase [Rickettsiales bacterium]